MKHSTSAYTRYRQDARSNIAAWVRAGVLAACVAGSLAAANTYLVHNLVSDLPNMADHVDPNLVNPWGNGFSSSSPFWIGNNHSGTSTLYDGTGTAIPLVVKIPSPSDPTGGGAPTGVLFNTPQAFAPSGGKAPTFMFCTEDGTILGWNSPATTATILIDRSSSNAVYKGCTIGGTSDAPRLYAADFHNASVGVWAADLSAVSLTGAFFDPLVPAGFAPFNIMTWNGKLYVTYAKQDSDKMDDVAGAGNGYIAVYDMNGALLNTLITGGSQSPLNSPWGMAIAPDTFGDFAGDLLVGNFGDGMIHAFDPATGALVGTLNDTSGNPIVIQGLWSLMFGNGGRGGDKATLYFAAGIPGPNGEALESHGLFGSIQAAPSFTADNVENGASFSGALAPNTWVSIKGGGLSATTRTWASADFVNNALPTKLDNVTVTLNGTPAYVEYVSPSQINFLVPANLAPGPVQVQTTNNGLTSAPVTVSAQAIAPSFFVFSNTKYIAATHSDNVSLVGPPNLISGATTTPATPGEEIVLYGNGFGVTDPPAPNGQLLTSALKLVTTPTITIGGTQADVKFAGLTEAGLFQFNVVVPTGLPAGDAAVVAKVGGVQSQANAFISVAAQ